MKVLVLGVMVLSWGNEGFGVEGVMKDLVLSWGNEGFGARGNEDLVLSWGNEGLVLRY